MIIYAILPDGTEIKLVDVPNYDFNWQTVYQCADPITVPKGTQLRAVGHFDNSTGNPANPDPTKDIIWGPQSFDEMLIGIIDIVKVGDPDSSESTD